MTIIFVPPNIVVQIVQRKIIKNNKKKKQNKNRFFRYMFDQKFWIENIGKKMS